MADTAGRVARGQALVEKRAGRGRPVAHRARRPVRLGRLTGSRRVYGVAMRGITTTAALGVLLGLAACGSGSDDTAAATTTTTTPVAGFCADWQALGAAPAGEAVGAVAETGVDLDDPAVAGPAGVIVTYLAGGTSEVVDPAAPGGRREWTAYEAMAQLTAYCDGLG